MPKYNALVYVHYVIPSINKRSTSQFCSYVRDKPYKEKQKANIVARCNAEVEYKVMALTTCEMMWIKS